MFHTIVLLAGFSSSMAVNAACTYSICSNGLYHFVIYSNQPISELPAYKRSCGSFVLGSYDSDLVMVPAPAVKCIRVHRTPEQLKIRYLAYIRKTVERLPSHHTLFLPLLAPCDGGLINLGQGVSISLAELVLPLSSLDSRNVKLWMPECNDPCWTRPGLPWTVLDENPPIHDRLRQAEPLNIAPFILPKAVDEAPPFFKYNKGDLQCAERQVAELASILATIDPSKLDHLSDHLCYALRQIRIVPTYDVPYSMRLHRLRELEDVNRIGDILAHRLNCFMTIHVLSRYIFNTPPHTLDVTGRNPRGAYWYWLEAICATPGKYFHEFLETTQIPLPVLSNLVGSRGLFFDGYASWQRSLFLLAANWAIAGRPPVTMESLASAKLWRIAAFAPDVLQLVQVVAQACKRREERGEKDDHDEVSLEDCLLFK